MSWRHDEKKARKLAESDPVAAAGLLERVIPRARESKLYDKDYFCGLLAFQAEVAERAGRHDLAASSTSELIATAEKGLAEEDERLAHEKGALRAAGVLQKRATYLECLGRQDEADRTRLHAADVLLASVGDAGAKAAMASSPVFLLTQGAMGFEAAHQFRKSFEQTYWVQAEALRNPLIENGKAVALAYCERCGGVVEADWEKHRCKEKHKVSEVRVVLTYEADTTRRELEQAAPARA
jgi:murein DD-endopeptidase MepM/ murein hydrolase activator NlpD